MALPDLFSVSDSQFKNSATIPPFAWNHHAVALRLIRVGNRLYVSAYRALYPDHTLIFYRLNIRHLRS